MSKIRKLIVEVIDARDLQPKDGHGTSSPYVVLDYYGQRRRTLTAVKTLNPTWNEKLDFNAGKTSNVFEDMLEVEVYHDKLIGPTSRNNFLGRLRLSASQCVSSGEEALIYYTLEKKHLFNWIKGELGLKIYYADEEIPPPPPPPPPPAVEEVKPPAEEWIINVVAGVTDVVKWVNDTRAWKNPTATLLVHALLVMLVWFPDLIVPTLAFYVFVIGVWNYRFKSRDPLPHFDPKISLAESIDRDELDEEFDGMPSNRPHEVVQVRYDKLRMLGARVQTVLGYFATQGERAQSLVTWRDPHATGIFVVLCLIVALILYLVPSKMVAMAFGFYYLRHPIFRDRMPTPALNFFRRLPSLSDRIM